MTTLLPQPLIMIALLRYRGSIRRLMRRMMTPSGAVFGLIYLIWFVAMVAQVLYAINHVKGWMRVDPEAVAASVLALLIAFALGRPQTTGRITFAPAEIDFLFPGPYSRKQLLSYKLAEMLLGLVLASLIAIACLGPFTESWELMGIGFFLSLNLTHWLGVCFALFLADLQERLGRTILGFIVIGTVRLVRLIVCLGILALLYEFYAPIYREAMAGADADVLFSRLSGPGLELFKTPLRPFLAVLLADSWTFEVLGWMALAVGINVFLVAAILLLDTDYMEAAIATSVSIYSRLERVRRGQYFTVRSSKRLKWSLPDLPFAAGAGPFAWRQMSTCVRSTGGLLTLVGLAGIASCAGIRLYGFEPQDVQSTGVGVAGVLGYLTLLALLMLRCDFRGDVDQFDYLKSAPVPAFAMALGQCLAPALAISFLHVCFATGAVILTNSPVILLLTLVVTLPFTMLFVVVENAVFLLAPTRGFSRGLADVNIIRNMSCMLLRIAVLLPAAGVALLAGAVGWALGGESLFLGAVATAAFLAMEAIGGLAIVGWLFERFDPSADLPA